jgi:hypothetical protein
MAETVAVPQKSLWERTLRVGNLLNQGVESMVAGTLSLPALVTDGYINIYRMGREAVGGRAFEASDLYSKSKQTLTDTGRKLDGSYGKVVGAQDATERKIVFGTELVTGLVGPGAIKSLKTLAESNAVLTAGTTAAKATTTATTTAATTTAGTAAAKAGGTIEWVAPKLSGETAEFAAQAAAKRAAREAAEAGATNTAGTAAKAAAVGEKAIEKTSKGLLGTVASAGLSTLQFGWTAGKIITWPVRHWLITGVGLGTAHQLTDGASSRAIIGAGSSAVGYVADKAPGIAAAAADASLWVGDGVMGFFTEGVKEGGEQLAEKLPFGTPAAVRAAVAGASAKVKGEKGEPSLRERAQDAMSGARERAGDAADAAREAADDIDVFDLPEAGPFREMIAKHLGMDPKKVNGKEMMSKMGEMAKNNPYAATGMAFGAMLGMMEGGTKGQKAMKAMVYGAVFAIGFQMIGQFFPGLMPAIGNMLGNGMKGLGLDTNTMKGQFTGAANGLTEAPRTPAPVARTAEAANDPVAQFRASADTATRPAPTPAPDQAPVVRTPAEIARARTNDRQFALEA